MAVFVHMARPEWRRSCSQCRAFLHDEDGLPKLDRRTSLPMRRPEWSKPEQKECHTCPKIPRSAPRKHWEYAADLTPQLAQVWTHYKMCRAVGTFPDDEWVRECAVRIREAEDAFADLERRTDANQHSSLLNLLVRRLTPSRK